jgi:hypothetical protein
MTTPPPYGKTAEQAETPSNDFGETTVSGKPTNGRSADTDPKSAVGAPASSPAAPVASPSPSAPAAPQPAGSAPTGPPSSARRTPPLPVRPAATPGGPPLSDRPTGFGSAAPSRGPSLPGVTSPAPAGLPPRPSTPLITGSAAPPLAGPIPSAAPMPGLAQPQPQPPKPSRADAARGPRRARLQLRHIDPWTVLKFSCVLSIALFFVWLIVIGVLFGILDAAGVVGKINDSVILINGSGSKAPVTAGIVFGGAAIIGVINIVLFIALSTIGSVVYNLCADLVGGIELTLSER